MLTTAIFGDPKDWLLPLGVMLLVVWALMRLSAKRRQSGRMPTASEQLERNHQARGLRGDMEKLMVEIEQFAKRIGAQLDAKAHRLESLIDEADEKIQQLQSMQQDSETGQTKTNSTGQAAPQTPSTEPTAPPAPAQMDTDDPLAQSVYQLADAGMDAKAIAGELGEHTGKVELILALRNA